MEQKIIEFASDELLGCYKKAYGALEIYSRMHLWVFNVEYKVAKQNSVWQITLTYENQHQLYWYGRLIERYLINNKWKVKTKIPHSIEWGISVINDVLNNV